MYFFTVDIIRKFGSLAKPKTTRKSPAMRRALIRFILQCSGNTQTIASSQFIIFETTSIIQIGMMEDVT